MTGRYRERSRRPARGTETREPRRRILVLCEGAVTERHYIEAFARWQRSAIVEVSSEQGVPRTLVETAVRLRHEADARARRERDAFLAFDEVWCVYDVDEHPNLNDAWQRAQSQGIHVAVSNPCFELWLLLHHQPLPGPRTRHQLQRSLAKLIPGRSKHVDFETHYRAGYEPAVARARRAHEALGEHRTHEAQSNPCTDVYELMESIRGRAG